MHSASRRLGAPLSASDGRATDLAREATDLVHAQDKPLGEILPAACSLAEQAAALHAAFAGLAGVICSLDVI